jgi:hypothetical protein
VRLWRKTSGRYRAIPVTGSIFTERKGRILHLLRSRQVTGSKWRKGGTRAYIAMAVFILVSDSPWPQRGSLLAALVATVLPALSSHRDLRNPAARSHAVNFRGYRLNLLRVHWSAKHGPGIGKPIHQLPLIPQSFSRNIASTSRSIRASSPPPACSKRSGAKTGISPWAAMSTRMASAANSEAEFPNRAWHQRLNIPRRHPQPFTGQKRRLTYFTNMALASQCPSSSGPPNRDFWEDFGLL